MIGTPYFEATGLEVSLLSAKLQQARPQSVRSITYPLERWKGIHIYEQHVISTKGPNQIEPKQGQACPFCDRSRTELNQFSIILH